MSHAHSVQQYIMDEETNICVFTFPLELGDDLTPITHRHVRQQRWHKFRITTEPVVNELDEDVRQVGYPVKNSAGCGCVICWRQSRSKNQT